jgi:hypothetical protein
MTTPEYAEIDRTLLDQVYFNKHLGAQPGFFRTEAEEFVGRLTTANTAALVEVDDLSHDELNQADMKAREYAEGSHVTDY